ncbi:hypothetical protein [Acidithiobacillus caldus]|jgi:hypothetical protein|nr:hypothetical protein [Acidithiobacillus caldus]MBU2730436.1 hypothetical protein [Acidithiobacillus caldus]MBU2735960.1 hypothetical protein [Acidithiobacillus caldus ATCC 51756]MBU2743925.1 hypothetical protein [Acidithiobacillus caldus]MBU2763095.1 hypothetical protein [Acidithiobacillus caldus]MBU2771069.1 hypothetical protein [Acidithiobacillus caldus]
MAKLLQIVGVSATKRLQALNIVVVIQAVDRPAWRYTIMRLSAIFTTPA